jgi:hypothetical protein
MAKEYMLWQAMPLFHFNTFWKLQALTLQRVSDKMNMDISDDMINKQDYNYHKEFSEITKNMFTDTLKKEFQEIIKTTADSKRRSKFREINDNINKYTKKLYKQIAQKAWFCCFYTTKKGAYPNASILEAFGKGMGVFCGFDKTEMENFCITTESGLDTIGVYRIFGKPITYCMDISEVKAAASDFVEQNTAYDRKSSRFQCDIEYLENVHEYVPTEETIAILQEFFVALSYCKEYSLDNESEFRITVMGKMTADNFLPGTNNLSIVRLMYDPAMVKELIVLESEYKNLSGSLYEDDCLVSTINDKDSCNKETNLFKEIISNGELIPGENIYGGSYYKHFVREDDTKKDEKVVKMYVWDR